MPFTALILAAGFGNRMKPLTQDKHKSLLEVAGKPILGRIIDSLIEYKIEHFCIVTGYKDQDIRKYILENYPSLNVFYIHNKDYYKTNNIHSVALALENINFKQDLLLIESDLVFESNVLCKLINSNYKNCALVSKYIMGMDGTVIAKSDDRINAVYPPHLHDKDFNFNNKYKTLNIYKFDKDFVYGEFKRFLTFYSSMIDNSCYYELILGIVIYMNRVSIHAVEVNPYDWAEVDDPNDLNIAEYIFNKKNKLKILSNSHGGYWNYPIIDMTYIRNFYYPTESMIAGMNRYFDKLIYNYGSSQEILNRKISYLELCDEENIIALSGAAQIYPILRNYFGDKKVAIPDLTFGEYRRIFKNIIYYNDLLDLNYSLEDAIDSSSVVCIINPNNPSGKIYETEYIFSLVKKYNSKFFFIDESFIDYSDQKSIKVLLEKNSFENIAILKSLSKAHGVPGLRIGYLYTKNRKFKEYIIHNLPIWNINSIAENFLELSLKYRSELHSSFQKAKIDREYLISKLKDIFFVTKIIDSHASFVTFLVEDKFWHEDLTNYLLESENLYLKEINNIEGFRGRFFRVALTSIDYIDIFIQAMKNYSLSKTKD